MALDFLILYEHTVREYESDLLLKLELERRGYTVRIRQLLDTKDLRLFGKDKPEVLVASCMYDNEAINSHVYNNIGKCNKIVNLHWEQMLSDTQEEGDWFNMNGNAKRCVQTCWGQRTAQRLQAHGMDAKNTPVTGAVMMDFLRPEFKGYFKDKETLCKEFGLDPAKQLHLYISSFGYASMTDQEVAELSKMAGTDFSGFARTNRVSMEKTLAWFDRYLGDHPEVELVYRRHPSEWKCKALDELAAKRPNFHVIFADSVKQWIVAADSISIWMSTAVAEVYMAGKSCHILRPVPIEHEYDPVIYKDAHYVTSYPEFAAAMAQPNPPFPIARDVIEGYFDLERKAETAQDDLGNLNVRIGDDGRPQTEEHGQQRRQNLPDLVELGPRFCQFDVRHSLLLVLGHHAVHELREEIVHLGEDVDVEDNIGQEGDDDEDGDQGRCNRPQEAYSRPFIAKASSQGQADGTEAQELDQCRHRVDEQPHEEAYGHAQQQGLAQAVFHENDDHGNGHDEITNKRKNRHVCTEKRKDQHNGGKTAGRRQRCDTPLLHNSSPFRRD